MLYRPPMKHLFGSPRVTMTVLGLGLLLALLGTPRQAQAGFVRWTLSASAGFGFEVHPVRRVQAENLMLAFGPGFVGDCVRLELGLLTAYGALFGQARREFHLELRPMVRLALPLLPLYGRIIFAGLNPSARDRNIAYGGAFGLNIPLGRLGIFVEAGTLPRRAEQQTHWVLEARAGLGVRL